MHWLQLFFEMIQNIRLVVEFENNYQDEDVDREEQENDQHQL